MCAYLRVTSFVGIVVGVALFGGCANPTLQDSSRYSVEDVTSVTSHRDGVPGGTRIDKISVKATVLAINSNQREATLLGVDGRETVLNAGPEIANFDQIRVGDQVSVVLVSEIFTFLNKAGDKNDAGDEEYLKRAEKGSKPSAMFAGSTTVRATIEDIRRDTREVTIMFLGGKTHKVRAREDVNLEDVTVGDEVVIRTTGSISISVVEP